jgi:hypothetical protein
MMGMQIDYAASSRSVNAKCLFCRVIGVLRGKGRMECMTMICAHALNRSGHSVVSPLDQPS